MAKNTAKHKARKVTAIDAYVASRLRQAREVVGMTQEGIAPQIGVSFQQLQKYENGSNRISAGRLALLAQIYGQPVGWFFAGAPLAGAKS